jgi:hypothetical protein
VVRDGNSNFEPGAPGRRKRPRSLKLIHGNTRANDRQMQNTEPATIAMPGTGTKSLPLGASTHDVKRILGHPDTAKTYSDEVWWLYFDLGIDCGFRRKDKMLIALNFFRDGVAGHKHAQVTTKEGLSPGIPKLVVLQRLGEPTESEGHWTDRLGNWHRGWVKYSSGIAFEFGHDSKADVMTIFSAY